MAPRKIEKRNSLLWYNSIAEKKCKFHERNYWAENPLFPVWKSASNLFLECSYLAAIIEPDSSYKFYSY